MLNVRELTELPPDSRAYSLFHGQISHGYQFLPEAKRRLPTGYYGLTSVGLALVALQTHLSSGANLQHLRLGIVGLGIGTLAAYGNPGDYIRYYEINPEVTRIANDARYFSYLKDCQARLEVIPGDARLSMEGELNRGQLQDFNLLAIDAFSGDAIPVHLLTEEAFEIYLKQVKSDGIIAVHITNAHFDLQPVLKRVAEHFKLAMPCSIRMVTALQLPIAIEYCFPGIRLLSTRFRPRREACSKTLEARPRLMDGSLQQPNFLS